MSVLSTTRKRVIPLCINRRHLLTAAVAIPVAAAIGLPATASAQPVANRPSGVVPPTKPFATLPFTRQEARKVRLTNTWETAENELVIVGEGHGALDFEGPYGTPVRAIADGRAVASYQSFMIRGGGPFNPNNPSDINTDWRDPYTEREGFLGAAGLFVELQMDKKVPGSDQNFVVQYFHLSAVNPKKATWLPPDRQEDTVTWDGQLFHNWYPSLIPRPQAEIRHVGVRVKCGDIVGWTGDSGIGFGKNDALNRETGIIAERDRAAEPPWDPQGVPVRVAPEDASMVHLQFYGGRNANNSKIFTFDGLDMYHRIQGEPGVPLGEIETGPMPIFKRNGRGRLLHTDEC